MNRGIGMPGWLLLCEFGDQVWLTFGSIPYLVGSALTEREPHDIDVRLILSDEEFVRRIGPLHQQDHAGTAWAYHCLAWSAYGSHMIGKPMDFQIQAQTSANEQHSKPRNALFTYWHVKKHAEEEKET